MSTLSTTGQFVTTGLSSEKSARDEENDVFDYPIAIASTAVNKFQKVSKELDLKVLQDVEGKMSIINDKKKELIGLGNSALGLFKPGVFPPACGTYESVDDGNNDISSGNSTIGSEEGGTPGTGTTTPQVGYSVVRADAVRIVRYPYLEQRIAPNDNALEGLKYPILTSGNAGEGEENIWVKNSIYTDPSGLSIYISSDAGDWDVTGFPGGVEGGDTLGRYYPINPTGTGVSSYEIGGSCTVGGQFNISELYESANSYYVGVQTGCTWSVGVGTTASNQTVNWNVEDNSLELSNPILGFGVLLGPAAGSGKLVVPVTQSCSDFQSKQQSLLADIDNARTDISSYLVSANTTKERKTGSQLELWSAQRTKTRNKQETAGLDNSPRNIEETIPAAESIDPQLPTNENTSDADRGQLTADSTIFTADSK